MDANIAAVIHTCNVHVACADQNLTSFRIVTVINKSPLSVAELASATSTTIHAWDDCYFGKKLFNV